MKKRESVAAFVLGFIGSLSLISAAVPLVSAVVMMSLMGMGGTEFTIAMVIVGVFAVASLLTFIGSCFCLKKSRLGGVLMLVGTLLATAYYVIQYASNPEMLNTSIITLMPTIIPLIETFVASILGIVAKRVEVNSNDVKPMPQAGYSQLPYPAQPQQVRPQQMPQGGYAARPAMPQQPRYPQQGGYPQQPKYPQGAPQGNYPQPPQRPMPRPMPPQDQNRR